MFDYRNSIFKNKYKNRYVIHAVTFRLYRNPVYITNYGNLKEELSKFPAINLGTIRQSVINIRNSKLPDPAKLPNAGSFFKNPCISTESAESLQQKYKDVPLYKTQDNGFKISAAWLIERCGWKGRREGNCGIHKDHSLVIVNYGNSTGKEILNLAVKIKDSVREKFNIDIETEVDIV
jgi:UDP-N-acetylmuramate dehydrogenase